MTWAKTVLHLCSVRLQAALQEVRLKPDTTDYREVKTLQGQVPLMNFELAAVADQLDRPRTVQLKTQSVAATN
jgi:hypothetical protein